MYHYRIKESALGGVGSDKPFEQAVADLAHDFLSDKAPTLMKSELGFQMLDKADDDSKGIGVCVFQPNGILMFVPVFFLRGEIKGHELIYLPDQDLFIPLKESWINELLGKKPSLIGDSVEKSFARQQGTVQPDLSIFRTPPKFASYLNPLITRKVPDFVSQLKRYVSHTGGGDFSKTASLMLRSMKKLNQSTRLTRFLKYASLHGLKKLNQLIESSLLTKKAFQKFYPQVNLSGYIDYQIKDAQSRYLLRREPNPNWQEEMIPSHKKAGYVSIISYSATLSNGSDFDLSEKEKEQLAKQQYLVVDTRNENQVAKEVDNSSSGKNSSRQEHKLLYTPTESGVYSVLMADGTFEDFVLVRQIDLASWSNPDAHQKTYLVCKEGNKNGLSLPGDMIFVRQRYNQSRFEKWLHALPDADDLSFIRDAEIVSFINEKGTCYGSLFTHGAKQYGVVIRFTSENTDVEIGNKWTTVLKKRGDKLYVPSDCKVAKQGGSSDEESWLFGQPEIVKYAEAKNFQTIKLATTAYDHCTINDKRYPTRYAGFCSLIKDFNLRERTAKELFKKADGNSSGCHVASIVVKKADTAISEFNRRPESNMYFPEPIDGDSAIFGGMVPTAPSSIQSVTPETEALQPNSGPYENTLNDPYPAENMMRVQQALQSGQEEVFNLSALKQFLNDGDLSSEIDREIPELIRGMNHAGQLLFRYYWKGEKFRELYGPQEMPELEASLRNIFELLGDVILLLKHKLKKDDAYGELTKLNLTDVDE